MAYGMPPAKVGVDSRAAQLIGFPRLLLASLASCGVVSGHCLSSLRDSQGPLVATRSHASIDLKAKKNPSYSK